MSIKGRKGAMIKQAPVCSITQRGSILSLGPSRLAL